MKTTVKPSLFQTAAGQYKMRLKELKRKKFKLKARLTLTVFLPAFLLVLFAKAFKAYLAIKVPALFTKPPIAGETESERKNTEPVPVKMTPVQKETID